MRALAALLLVAWLWPVQAQQAAAYDPKDFKRVVFKTRFELQRDGLALGLVHEPEALTTRRRLCAEAPADVPPPVQAFLLFLVINLAFG